MLIESKKIKISSSVILTFFFLNTVLTPQPFASDSMLEAGANPHYPVVEYSPEPETSPAPSPETDANKNFYNESPLSTAMPEDEMIACLPGSTHPSCAGEEPEGTKWVGGCTETPDGKVCTDDPRYSNPPSIPENPTNGNTPLNPLVPPVPMFDPSSPPASPESPMVEPISYVDPVPPLLEETLSVGIGSGSSAGANEEVWPADFEVIAEPSPAAEGISQEELLIQRIPDWENRYQYCNDHPEEPECVCVYNPYDPRCKCSIAPDDPACNPNPGPVNPPVGQPPVESPKDEPVNPAPIEPDPPAERQPGGHGEGTDDPNWRGEDGQYYVEVPVIDNPGFENPVIEPIDYYDPKEPIFELPPYVDPKEGPISEPECATNPWAAGCDPTWEKKYCINNPGAPECGSGDEGKVTDGIKPVVDPGMYSPPSEMYAPGTPQGYIDQNPDAIAVTPMPGEEESFSLFTSNLEASGFFETPCIDEDTREQCLAQWCQYDPSLSWCNLPDPPPAPQPPPAPPEDPIVIVGPPLENPKDEPVAPQPPAEEDPVERQPGENIPGTDDPSKLPGEDGNYYVEEPAVTPPSFENPVDEPPIYDPKEPIFELPPYVDPKEGPVSEPECATNPWAAGCDPAWEKKYCIEHSQDARCGGNNPIVDPPYNPDPKDPVVDPPYNPNPEPKNPVVDPPGSYDPKEPAFELPYIDPMVPPVPMLNPSSPPASPESPMVEPISYVDPVPPLLEETLSVGIGSGSSAGANEEVWPADFEVIAEPSPAAEGISQEELLIQRIPDWENRYQYCNDHPEEPECVCVYNPYDPRCKCSIAPDDPACNPNPGPVNPPVGQPPVESPKDEPVNPAPIEPDPPAERHPGGHGEGTNDPNWEGEHGQYYVQVPAAGIDYGAGVVTPYGPQPVKPGVPQNPGTNPVNPVNNDALPPEDLAKICNANPKDSRCLSDGGDDVVCTQDSTDSRCRDINDQPTLECHNDSSGNRVCQLVDPNGPVAPGTPQNPGTDPVSPGNNDALPPEDLAKICNANPKDPRCSGGGGGGLIVCAMGSDLPVCRNFNDRPQDWDENGCVEMPPYGKICREGGGNNGNINVGDGGDSGNSGPPTDQPVDCDANPMRPGCAPNICTTNPWMPGAGCSQDDQDNFCDTHSDERCGSNNPPPNDPLVPGDPGDGFNPPTYEPPSCVYDPIRGLVNCGGDTNVDICTINPNDPSCDPCYGNGHLPACQGTSYDPGNPIRTLAADRTASELTPTVEAILEPAYNHEYYEFMMRLYEYEEQQRQASLAVYAQYAANLEGSAAALPHNPENPGGGEDPVVDPPYNPNPQNPNEGQSEWEIYCRQNPSAEGCGQNPVVDPPYNPTDSIIGSPYNPQSPVMDSNQEDLMADPNLVASEEAKPVETIKADAVFAPAQGKEPELKTVEPECSSNPWASGCDPAWEQKYCINHSDDTRCGQKKSDGDKTPQVTSDERPAEVFASAGKVTPTVEAILDPAYNPAYYEFMMKLYAEEERSRNMPRYNVSAAKEIALVIPTATLSAGAAAANSNSSAKQTEEKAEVRTVNNAVEKKEEISKTAETEAKTQDPLAPQAKKALDLLISQAGIVAYGNVVIEARQTQMPLAGDVMLPLIDYEITLQDVQYAALASSGNAPTAIQTIKDEERDREQTASSREYASYTVGSFSGGSLIMNLAARFMGIDVEPSVKLNVRSSAPLRADQGSLDGLTADSIK